MNPKNNLCVIIPTYNRPEILRHCILGLQQNLRFEGQITYLVGDDSEDISRTLEATDGLRSVTVVPGPKEGFGKNVNTLLRSAESTGWELFLQLDDDHILTHPIDLTRHAEKLTLDPTVGAIRLMGIAGHNYEARLRGLYWEISWDSPELYITSNRPHLKHRRLHDVFGLYPEGLRLGHTEESFCHQCRDIAKVYGGPKVLVPLDTITEASWQHIGDSWQLHGR